LILIPPLSQPTSHPDAEEAEAVFSLCMAHLVQRGSPYNFSIRSSHPWISLR
jgi:hypothetical protein